MIRKLFVAGTAAVVLSIALASSASAKVNAPGVAACKNGGWSSLTTAAGGVPFANQGACVSFAARGGMPVPVGPPPGCTTTRERMTHPHPDIGEIHLVTLTCTGLRPGSDVLFNGFFTLATADADGSAVAQVGLGGDFCAPTWFSATLADGTPIEVTSYGTEAGDPDCT